MVTLHKRSSGLKNILLFQVLSYFFLHLTYSINEGDNALKLLNFLNFYKDHLYLVYAGGIAFSFTIMAHKLSKIFYSMFAVFFLYETAEIFLKDLDKYILILGFIYLVMSFYFYLFLKLELEESIYQPSFHRLDIGDLDLHGIQVSLDGKFGKDFSGYLTNWDAVSCFVNLKQPKNSIKGAVGIKIVYQGNSFYHRGEIVTSYASGVGIRFKQDRRTRKKTMYDWADFYTIINDMGLVPRNT